MSLIAESHQSAHVTVHTEAAAHRAGMYGVDGHAGAVEAGGQLAREENVGQLGAAVGIHGGVALLALQIVEAHAAPGRMVSHRGEVDDPRRCALGDAGEEQFGQEEVPEMIDPERLLETLRRLLAFASRSRPRC